MVSLSRRIELQRGYAGAVPVRAPAAPWGSRRLPRALRTGDPRRTLFRSLLRHAEGVPVAFPDGSTGVVDEVVLSEIGFDFWAQELVVATANGRRRVPTGAVARIDPRAPRLEIVAVPPPR